MSFWEEEERPTSSTYAHAQHTVHRRAHDAPSTYPIAVPTSRGRRGGGRRGDRSTTGGDDPSRRGVITSRRLRLVYQRGRR